MLRSVLIGCLWCGCENYWGNEVVENGENEIWEEMREILKNHKMVTMKRRFFEIFRRFRITFREFDQKTLLVK